MTGQAAKRTMTLNLTDAEMTVLEDMCERKDMNKTTLVRRALRMYQVIDMRLEQGGKLFVENDLTKEKAELMML